MLVGQAECRLQPTGADQRGYNPDDDDTVVGGIHCPGSGPSHLSHANGDQCPVFGVFLCDQRPGMYPLFVFIDPQELSYHSAKRNPALSIFITRDVITHFYSSRNKNVPYV